MSITIFGHSDDLIEVEGSIEFEFTSHSDDNNYISCSDGTLLRMSYNGVWNILPIVKGSAFVEIRSAMDIDSDYSDKAILTDGMEWIALGATAVATPTKVYSL